MRVADLIVKALEAHSLSRVYCVPGESYLALLDALYESPIKTIVCRHESGAGFMAVAEAKMTGRPAVFMVSRGPGATNGSIAVHVAQQDAVPLIVLIGQVSREERGARRLPGSRLLAFLRRDGEGRLRTSRCLEGRRDDGARLPPRGARRAGTGGDLAAGGFARGQDGAASSLPPFPSRGRSTRHSRSKRCKSSSMLRNGPC